MIQFLWSRFRLLISFVSRIGDASGVHLTTVRLQDTRRMLLCKELLKIVIIIIKTFKVSHNLFKVHIALQSHTSSTRV
jgi:hypothetical protein